MSTAVTLCRAISLTNSPHWHGPRPSAKIMDTQAPRDEASVKLPERHRFGNRPHGDLSEGERREIAAADVLLAHRRSRILTALIIAVLQLGLLHRVESGETVDTTFAG